jgi:outer membrane protease
MKHPLLPAALFVLLAAAPRRVSALDLSFEISSGLKSGMTKEYVYEGEKCVSRLDWTDDGVSVLLFTGQAEFPNRRETASPKSFVRTSLAAAVPMKSGPMEDYAFLLPGSDAPSLYSKHNAYVDKDFTGVFETGGIFRFRNWEVVPAIGLSYTNRKWTAQDGYLQYPVSGPWTGDETKQWVAGPVVSYEQLLLHLFISLSAGYTVKNRIAFTLTGSISPFVAGETIDTHFLRSTRLYDTLDGDEFFSKGFAWNAGLSIRYYPPRQQQLAFFIRGDYGAIHNLTGSAASGTIGINDGTLVIKQGYGAKVESSAMEVFLGMILSIPW